MSEPSRISVICPSRLQVNPVSPDDRLYLDRALMTAKRQTSALEVELVVAVDPGRRADIPERFLEVADRGPQLVIAEGEHPGQAAAINAGVQASSGDVIAFLEDDDRWDPYKLALQLPLLAGYDLVTTNQREVDFQDNFLRYNDFPTPSGWLMKRETWEMVGGFDEAFRYHVDTEWLGRANRAGIKRAHLVHASANLEGDWMQRVREHSDIMRAEEAYEPLVTRMVNPSGGMETIRASAKAAEISAQEHARMVAAFGGVPW